MLKYLFEAEFLDGGIYRQNPEDHSKKNPPIKDAEGNYQGKSAFSDIREEVEKYSLKKFSLIEAGKEVVSVNLVTGIFTVMGVDILVESEKIPTMPEKFKLIYYRQWTRSMTVDVQVQEDMSIKQTGQKEEEPFCEFFIGWECEVQGKKYTQKLAVA